MKKTIAVLLTLLFVGSVLAIPMTNSVTGKNAANTTTGENQIADGWKKGDINGDGTIDAFDIDPFIKVLKHPWFYKHFFPKMFHAADINEDGKVNQKDVDPFVYLLVHQ